MLSCPAGKVEIGGVGILLMLNAYSSRPPIIRQAVRANISCAVLQARGCCATHVRLSQKVSEDEYLQLLNSIWQAPDIDEENAGLLLQKENA